jgi:hypothetical protein
LKYHRVIFLKKPSGLPKIHEHDGKRRKEEFIDTRLVSLHFECDLRMEEDPEVQRSIVKRKSAANGS